MNITVALVGTAHIHTPGFVKRLSTRGNARVKYVWDHDFERARRWANETGAQTVEELSRIWEDDEVSGVVICSETNRHEKLVAEAADAKKNMFVEKPLGLGAEDAYRMAAAVEKSGVLFQTGYFMRSQAIHLFLKDQIDAGNFGKITRVRMSNCHSGSLKGWFDTEYRWMADPIVAGCGAFGDLGTHRLDIMLWLFGNPATVTADIAVATGRYGECDEYGEGLLRFPGATIGVLAAGWVDLADPAPLLISGTEGHAHVCNGHLYYRSDRVKGASGESPWTELPDELPHAFELFLDALEGKKVTLVGAREAAHRSAVTEALYRAAREKSWIPPRYDKLPSAQ